MKWLKKFGVSEEHGKRLMFYLALLVAAAYFAFTSPENAWLAIGLCAGIVVAVLLEIIQRAKERKQQKFSTKNQETVENPPEEPNINENRQEEPDHQKE